ncbi:hypothetical protein TrCOL_g5328 [Triparma columacea]|uniref:Uncharacterized protein n=1 Tax=Triparma columacea TaxID=722753 RepID=A0A9W7FXI1_9STRA|nr:hypothetical protein TrCOL_g5328 [Triparma columacea]
MFSLLLLFFFLLPFSAPSPIKFDPISLLTSSRIPTNLLPSDALSLRQALLLCRYSHCTLDVLTRELLITSLSVPSPPSDFWQLSALEFDVVKLRYGKNDESARVRANVLSLTLTSPVCRLFVQPDGKTNFGELQKLNFPPKLSASKVELPTGEAGDEILINELSFQGSEPVVEVHLQRPTSKVEGTIAKVRESDSEAEAVANYKVPEHVLKRVSKLVSDGARASQIGGISSSEVEALLRREVKDFIRGKIEARLKEVVKESLEKGMGAIPGGISDFDKAGGARGVLKGVLGEVKRGVYEGIEVSVENAKEGGWKGWRRIREIGEEVVGEEVARKLGEKGVKMEDLRKVWEYVREEREGGEGAGNGGMGKVERGEEKEREEEEKERGERNKKEEWDAVIETLIRHGGGGG